MRSSPPDRRDGKMHAPSNSTDRWFVAAAILITVAGSVRVAATYRIFNFTIDEPAHAACGIQWLDGGKYEYEDQHPPLARVIAALGIRYAGNKWSGDTNMWYEGYRLLGGGSRHERGLVYGRAAMLPLFWVGAAVVFLWGYRIAGADAGLLGTLLFTSLPPVMAHAGLIATDMALASMTGATVLASIWWAERPTPFRTGLFGTVLGLALLSKFSALVFLPGAWLAIFVCHLGRRGLACARRELSILWRPAFGVTVVAALIVWAGYRFTFQRIDLFPFPVPAPALFTGIRTLWKHNMEGHPSYLLGKQSMKGFWYYYPVAIAFKTPVAFLMLLILSIPARFRVLPDKRLRALMPLAFSVGILLAAMCGSINIGVRHVLPVYVGLSVVAGITAARMLRGLRGWSVAAVVLLGSHVASGALQAPDYLAYTNELHWNRPEAILADSDVDWGQDMKRLANRLKALHVTTVNFVPFNFGYLMSGAPFPSIGRVRGGITPPAGWTAVSVTPWKAGGGPCWLNVTPPAERVGRSILLFHVARAGFGAWEAPERSNSQHPFNPALQDHRIR